MTDLIDSREPTAAVQFPMTRTCPMHMPPQYAELRDEQPVAEATMRMTGARALLLTRHADVKKVLNDKAMSSDAKRPGYLHQIPIPEEIIQFIKFPFVAMDAPEHTARRRLVIPEFTAKRVQALRPRMQEIVDERIDAILAMDGPVDLVRELAAPVPSLFFCELLGADPADIDTFRRFAEVTTNRDAGPEETNAVFAEMETFFGGLIRQKAADPGDDLLSRLVARNEESEEKLDHDDLVAIARTLIIAAFDATTKMISLGALTLLEHPEAVDEILRDPSSTGKAVDELLRYLSVLDGSVRVPTEDVELSGVRIPAGQGVVALNGAANWDPEVFPEPEKFDIHRDASEHLAFGSGAHQCLGANLARVQLEIIYSTLFTRIPTLKLAVPVDDLPFTEGGHVHGPYEVPVTW
ncbi:cytochrome P450 [Saccharothrix deserti]|uniref:cytochrome P450 n=1 Tax=Saccharothrix deserti TaxID=2593674 RepID=UPI00131C2A36|nr:cytochrome P450 [Saccharothrix deserti]